MPELPPEAPEDSKTARKVVDLKPGVDYTPNEEQLKEMINERLKGSRWRLETLGQPRDERPGITQILAFKDKKTGQEALTEELDNDGEIKTVPRRFEMSTDIASNFERCQVFLAELLDT